MNDTLAAYPEGRWTPRRHAPVSTSSSPSLAVSTAAGSPAASAVSATALARAPGELHDLFWGAPDLQMLDETRAYIDRLLATAAAEAAHRHR